MEVVLEAVGLTKRMKRSTLVDNVDLSIRKGEVFGLLGPNGAGKTTTIRMLSGLIRPTKGTVHINGADLKQQKRKALSDVGAVVENPELYDHLSGWDNLKHYARMQSGITIPDIVEAAEKTGIADRLKEKTGTYSLGMRQRLGLAQALLHKPRVLILDEPTNGLDPAGIREMRSYFRELAEKEGISILVSSHLLSEMQLLCDRAAVMQNGRIIHTATIKELLHANKQIVLKTEDMELAANALSEQTTITKDGLLIEADSAEVPDLNRTLVEAGVRVQALYPEENGTLEETFLSMTGGKAG
ncbi:ABC transporter ATP-binding protein [Alkalicoccus luteus]|uniref:ABC transporter ATP-binding protein n=1 Tax=Alkalicoccus luteus TaxID=1237094 RepID=UPI0040342D60